MAAAMEAAAQVVVRVVARAEVEREAATAAATAVATAVARAEAVKAAAQVVERARYMSAGGGDSFRRRRGPLPSAEGTPTVGGGDPLRQRTCALGWGELWGRAGTGEVCVHITARSRTALQERDRSR